MSVSGAMPDRTVYSRLVKVEVVAGAIMFGDDVLSPTTYTIKVRRGHEHYAYAALTRQEAAERVLEALDGALDGIPDAGLRS